jgi:hypothetical protein
MGQPTFHAPVARLLAVITRYDEALAWTKATLAGAWGPVALQSPSFPFRETDYYTATMGPELNKTFLVFEPLADPGDVADWKFRSNAWEDEYAALRRHDELRPLNLDVGYITPAKLVLASTKDHAHRMYLGRGMYAEVTLFYKHRMWQHHDFTFPDYRRADYHAFFEEVRRWLRQQSTKPALP